MKTAFQFVSRNLLTISSPLTSVPKGLSIVVQYLKTSQPAVPSVLNGVCRSQLWILQLVTQLQTLSTTPSSLTSHFVVIGQATHMPHLAVRGHAQIDYKILQTLL